MDVDLEPTSNLFVAALTANPGTDSELSPKERSRLAVYRVTELFNGNRDLLATIGGAVSVTSLLMSTAHSLNDRTDVEAFVSEVAVEADALLE